MARSTSKWSRLSAIVVALATSASAAELDLVQFTDRAGDFKPYTTRDGVTLERRPVRGSSYYEHRAIVDLAVDPARAEAEVWRSMSEGDMDSLKLRRILHSSNDELVIYDQIRTPVVSDRDYTIVVRRVRAPGRVEIRCDTANELGPPIVPGLVRIPSIHAGWMIEPHAGGTRLTYFAFSEPGGLIAAFLARPAQAKRSLADVRRMVARVARFDPGRRN